MPPTEQSPRLCTGFTEGWCARLGLAKAFEANTAWDGHMFGLDPLHLFQEKRDAAAVYIGKGGCAESATIITQPESPAHNED